jgi:hypothetical protein
MKKLIILSALIATFGISIDGHCTVNPYTTTKLKLWELAGRSEDDAAIEKKLEEVRNAAGFCLKSLKTNIEKVQAAMKKTKNNNGNLLEKKPLKKLIESEIS